MTALRLLAAVLLLGLSATAGHAETGEIRIAQQFGISYLPLILMKSQGLVEQAAERAGLPRPTVTWAQVSGAAAMNDALISGSLDFAAAGVPPMIITWAKTRSSLKMMGVAALGSMPNLLLTSNPKIRTLADFGPSDRIALPAVKIGSQAIYLQMGAEQAFGAGQSGRLDDLTVSLSHPDGLVALLGGHAEIDAHFTSPPFTLQELADPRIHAVLNTYDVLGGPHSFNALYAPARFHDRNPKSFAAVLAALDAAMAFITQQPAAAADLYLAAEPSSLQRDRIEAIIRDPANRWTATPEATLKQAQFLYRTGVIKVEAKDWRDLFFADIHDRPGS